MNKKFTISILSMLLVMIPAIHFGQNHPNGVDFLIEGLQYPDFTYAGVPGGIPSNPSGDTYEVSGNDRAAVQSAVDQAESAGGGIVYLPAGTYYFDDRVVIDQSNVVIRGAGQDQTTVILQNASSNSHDWGAFSFVGEGRKGSYLWVLSDVEKGDKTLEVQDASSNYSAGDLILLKVHSDDMIKTNDFYRKKFHLYNEGGDWSYSHQIIYIIEEVNGNFITLTQPIRFSFKKSSESKMSNDSFKTGTFVQKVIVLKNCGIENLRIETEVFADFTSNPGSMKTSGVHFEYVYSCWVKDLYVRYPGSIPVHFIDAKNIEVRNVIADNAYNLGVGGNGYLPLWKTADGLMTNITADSLRHAPNFQAYANGCVFKDSYFEDQNGEWHGQFTIENLYENVIIKNIDGERGLNSLASNMLDDTYTGHEPHLHGQVIYNCDLQIHKDNCISVRLGGLHKNWIFAYNRILNQFKQPTVYIGDYADTLFFINNNIGILGYSGNDREYAVKFEDRGWDTVSQQYTGIAPHYKNIIFKDNDFYGFPSDRIWQNAPSSALTDQNNTVHASTNPSRPSPAIPSIFDYERNMKSNQPDVEISTSFSGRETSSNFDVTVAVSGGGTYGSCSKVKLYNGDDFIGEDNSAPYEFNVVVSTIEKGFIRLKAEAAFDSENFYDKYMVKNNFDGTPCDQPAVAIGSNSPVDEGNDINLTENGGDATSWNWSGPNSFSSSDQNPTISSVTSLAAGTYFVTVTDANGCKNTDKIDVTVNDIIISIPSSSHSSESVSLEIYPNPLTQNSEVNVKLTGFNDELSVMDFYDVTGKLIFSKELNTIHQKSFKFELPQLYKGVYLISVKGKNNVITKKLTIR